MAVIVPTITTNNTPGLEVTTPVQGLTYANIVESLGPIVLAVRELYYKPSTFAQLNNPIQYTDYNINGNQSKVLLSSPVNPMQFNSTWWFLLEPIKMKFDGNQAINFNIQPGITVQFYFYGKMIQNRDDLDAMYINNFEALESEMGHPDFFKDYKEDV